MHLNFKLLMHDLTIMIYIILYNFKFYHQLVYSYNFNIIILLSFNHQVILNYNKYYIQMYYHLSFQDIYNLNYLKYILYKDQLILMSLLIYHLLNMIHHLIIYQIYLILQEHQQLNELFFINPFLYKFKHCMFY